MPQLTLLFENRDAQAGEVTAFTPESSLVQHYESNASDLDIARGDLLYAVSDSGIAWNGNGHVDARDANDVYYVGRVIDVGGGINPCKTCASVVLDWEATTPYPTPQNWHFCFYVKNHAGHDRGPKGYYAEVKMVNNSTEDAELYAVSSDIGESSK